MNMRWDSDMLAKIDERCKIKGRTRSEWVQAACEYVLEQIETPTVVERATMRMRIEPIAGNQSGPWKAEIAEREAGRAERKQSHADKKALGMIGPFPPELKVDLQTGEVT